MKTSHALPALAIAACALLSGCAMQTYRKDAFGKSKTYAVVTLAAMPKVEVYAGPNGGRSLTGMLKSAKSDVGYSDKADKILADTTPLLLQELDKSRQFRLLPSDSVLGHRAYKGSAPDEPKVLMTTFALPAGYRYFKDKAKLAKLAGELKVDGVIVVHVTYTAAFNGVQAFGLVAGGRHRGKTSLAVAAYDRKGQPVWTDHVEHVSEESLSAVGEAVNFVKLQPLLVSSTRGAARQLVGRLDNQVAAR